MRIFYNGVKKRNGEMEKEREREGERGRGRGRSRRDLKHSGTYKTRTWAMKKDSIASSFRSARADTIEGTMFRIQWPIVLSTLQFPS